MSDYYSDSGDPIQGADATTPQFRAQYAAIALGFTKVAPYTGNAGKLVAINAGGTAQEAITTTGTGSGVRATSPTLVTPNIGVATATSINKVVITAPASGATLTLADGSSLVTAGAFSVTLTATAGTGLTLPTTGTLGTLAGTEEFTNKTLNASVGKGTWTASGTWTLPALTLGGTISGGGNQINNVVIGTTTPLAGSFTTLSASGDFSVGSGKFLVESDTGVLTITPSGNGSTTVQGNGFFVDSPTPNSCRSQFTGLGLGSCRLDSNNNQAAFPGWRMDLDGNAPKMAFSYASAGNGTYNEILSLTQFGVVSAVQAFVGWSATAIPAGGTTGAGFRFFSTSNFGVFGGSDAPTLSAAKGSIYLRSNGSGATDRAYINTDGGTTWTALVTVA